MVYYFGDSIFGNPGFYVVKLQLNGQKYENLQQ